MADSENRTDGWEKGVLEKLALASLHEHRRARQWGIFFKSLTFIYLFILLFLATDLFTGDEMSRVRKHTALVELRGVISPDSVSSADNVNAGLQEAFKDAKTQGVILRINSPAAVRCRPATSMMRSAVSVPSIRKFRFMPSSRMYAPQGAIMSHPLPTRFTWTKPVWSVLSGC